jgi:hypothetical protein
MILDQCQFWYNNKYCLVPFCTLLGSVLQSECGDSFLHTDTDSRSPTSCSSKRIWATCTFYYGAMDKIEVAYSFPRTFDQHKYFIMFFCLSFKSLNLLSRAQNSNLWTSSCSTSFWFLYFGTTKSSCETRKCKIAMQYNYKLNASIGFKYGILPSHTKRASTNLWVPLIFKFIESDVNNDTRETSLLCEGWSGVAVQKRCLLS